MRWYLFAFCDKKISNASIYRSNYLSVYLRFMSQTIYQSIYVLSLKLSINLSTFLCLKLSISLSTLGMKRQDTRQHQQRGTLPIKSLSSTR